MKEKFLQFFAGKMGKSVYIAAASAVVCVATVAGSMVAVHNHNQKIDAVLESLEQAESITETVTESAEESVSASSEVNTQQNANGEPEGDKALQYIAEYDKLTAEYQAKRAELEKELKYVKKPVEPKLQGVVKTPDISDEEYQREKEKVEKENESRMAVYEFECASVESVNQYTKEVEKQIAALNSQYQKDVSALKARYGI